MDRQPRLRMDWEAIFHGSEREVSTVIIGCEADFRSRKRISKGERARLIWRLKEYANLSYDSEATIAADIGVSWDAPNGWLRGKSKPTFKSLLKIREFLQRQPRPRGGIDRLTIHRYQATTRMDAEGNEPLDRLLSVNSVQEPIEKTL